MTDQERITALRRLGYDEREAGFLVLAALHSGYFLRRQFEIFARLKRGKLATAFLKKTLDAGHARITVYSNRTEVFHLFSRPFYRAIGEPDNRNRRPRPPLSIKAKLMALDYVLAHHAHRYLPTEQTKLDYFARKLGIDRSKLPGKTYRASAIQEETRRYFIEKYPIFLSTEQGSASPVACFCYVDEGVLSTAGFDSFLQRYRRLFIALRRFRLIYVAAQLIHVRSAQQRFDRFGKQLSSPAQRRPKGILGDYFWLRYLFETEQYALLDKADLDRLRVLNDRFDNVGTTERFRLWKGEMAAAEASAPIYTTFETVVLRYDYDIFASKTTGEQARTGEHLIAAGVPREEMS